MKRIEVRTKTNPYPVYIGRDILSSLPDHVGNYSNTNQVAIISSDPIYSLYGERIVAALEKRFDVLTLLVPDGEGAKSLDHVDGLYTKLLESKFERKSMIIALGGGVIGDLAGFVAATFLRGVDLVQVPTTLLAQVDSSIGGKVGINHPLGKNLIGAFKQPLFVFSDVNMLQTLEPQELRCGLGEVIKYGFIGSEDFFKFLEENLDKALKGDLEILNDLVTHSSTIKADVVSKDEKEAGLRMILNFGHTFGHALETEFSYSRIKHGEAVILGMMCALEYGHIAGFLNAGVYERGMRLLQRVPVVFPDITLDYSDLVENMTLDKKVKDHKIRLILIKDFGKHFIHSVEKRDTLFQAWEILNNHL